MRKLTPPPGEETPGPQPGNTAWMITATALVLFMTLPGLALFYGRLGSVQNVLSVLMHCFAIACHGFHNLGCGRIQFGSNSRRFGR